MVHHTTRTRNHSPEPADDLARSCGNLGHVYQQEQQYEKAISWYERGAAMLRELDVQGKLQPQYQPWLKHLEQSIAKCKEAQEKPADQNPPGTTQVVPRQRGRGTFTVGTG